MLKHLVHRLLDHQERRLGASMDWLRDLYAVSPRGFWQFARMRGMLYHREALPERVWAVAHLAAAQCEDCGPCVDISMRLARQAGVEEREIRAVLEARDDALAAELALTRQFVVAVSHMDPGAETLRPAIRAAFGLKGEVDLAFAILSGRAIPILKRGLGQAVSCSIHQRETGGDGWATTAGSGGQSVT